jgi:hypothetical protein
MNYNKTFSPTVRNSSTIFLLSFVAELGLDTDHQDVSVIFLNGDLQEACTHEPQKFISENKTKPV